MTHQAFIKAITLFTFLFAVVFCKAQCIEGFTYTTVDAECAYSNGTITVTSVQNAAIPLFYSINGSPYFPFVDTIRNLPAGLYQLTVKDINGCTATQNIFINASPVNKWMGFINTAWEEPRNWSCAEVPNENSFVKIGAGSVVVVNSDARVYNLTIANGANLTVTAGFSLTALH